MSTWMYLECLDHDPPLQADGEVGQHTYDLPDIQRYIADRRRYETEADNDTTYAWPRQYGHHFERNAAEFLVQHRKCRIGIRDEYGDNDYPTTTRRGQA